MIELPERKVAGKELIYLSMNLKRDRATNIYTSTTNKVQHQDDFDFMKC